MVLLILAILAGILIGAVVFFVLRSRDDKLKDDLVGRVVKMQKFAETASFKTPESTDLVYGVRYANAFIKRGENTYDLTIFDGTGILEQHNGVGEEKIHAMRLTGGWCLAAERYSTVDGVFGKMMQLERRVSEN